MCLSVTQVILLAEFIIVILNMLKQRLSVTKYEQGRNQLEEMFRRIIILTLQVLS